MISDAVLVVRMNIYVLKKSVLNHVIARGSYINVALLDVSKSFDRVNHFKLFTVLKLDYLLVLLKFYLIYYF